MPRRSLRLARRMASFFGTKHANQPSTSSISSMATLSFQPTKSPLTDSSRRLQIFFYHCGLKMLCLWTTTTTLSLLTSKSKKSLKSPALRLLKKDLSLRQISTPTPRLWTMDMKKNHHTPTSQHLPTTTLKNHPISTLPPRLWTMDMGKNRQTSTYLHLPTTALKNRPISTLPPRLWTIILLTIHPMIPFKLLYSVPLCL